MNEMPTNPDSEEQNGEERYAQWMSEHPEIEISPENLRECEPEIAEFEEIVAQFESTYSLEELHLISDLTSEEAPHHPLREPAKVALLPIVEKLTILRRETNISSEKHSELMAKYKNLSRAVGIINNNKVDHNR